MNDISLSLKGDVIRSLLSSSPSSLLAFPANQANAFYSSSTKDLWKHSSLDDAWADRDHLHVPCHHNLDLGLVAACDICKRRGWGGTVHRLWSKITEGDWIWVRERHARVGTLDPGILVYEADYPRCPSLSGVENIPARIQDEGYRWMPARKMALEDSRLTLHVKTVRFGRLQEMTELQAVQALPADCTGDPVVTFLDRWERQYPDYGYVNDPWVIFVSFATIHKNIRTVPDAARAAVSLEID